MMLALEHAKAVLCEKPFTTNAAEARRVVAASRKANLFCMEAMWMRFVPLVRELKQIVSQGTIGAVRMVSANLGMPFQYDPQHRVFDPALGGGALLDLGIYGLSFAFHFLGVPTAVASQAVIGASGVDEQATVLLSFPEERQATITASLRTRTTNDAAILGDEGMIRVQEPLYCPEVATIIRTHKQPGTSPGPATRRSLASLKNQPLVRDLRARMLRARNETTIQHRRIGNGYPHEAIEVMRCLRQGISESPLMPLDESLAILETVDAIRAQWSKQ
jgi:predicted dehydrogenase